MSDRRTHAQECIETPKFQMSTEVAPRTAHKSWRRVETRGGYPLLGDEEHFGARIAADDVEPTVSQRNDVNTDPACRVEYAGTGG